MTATCARAVRSLRVCAFLNLGQAKAARKAGRPRMAAYHLRVAKECRRDARLLKSTARKDG